MHKQLKTIPMLQDSRQLYEKRFPALGYALLLLVLLLITAAVIWSVYTPITYASQGADKETYMDYVLKILGISQYNMAVSDSVKSTLNPNVGFISTIVLFVCFAVYYIASRKRYWFW